MRYIAVQWHQTNPEYPVWLYPEIDDAGWEQRKVEVYADGTPDFAGEVTMSNRTRILRNVALVSAMSMLAMGCFGVADTLIARPSPGAGTKTVVTLQYRTAHDAFAPSRFVGVVDGGITPGLTLVWELPPAKSEDEKVAQQGEKEQFQRQIEMLEARQINGVEFECIGRLDGFILHVAAVPRLTASGLRDIEGL